MRKITVFLFSLLICSTGFAEVLCRATTSRDLRNMKLNLTRSLQVRGVYRSLFNAEKNTFVVPDQACKTAHLRASGATDTVCDISHGENYKVQLWVSPEVFEGHTQANSALVKGTLKENLNSRTLAYLTCKIK